MWVFGPLGVGKIGGLMIRVMVYRGLCWGRLLMETPIILQVGDLGYIPRPTYKTAFDLSSSSLSL